MKRASLEAVESKDNIADIINYILEAVFKNNFELPAFDTIHRLARAARAVFNRRCYQLICEQLGSQQKNDIDKMFEIDSAHKSSIWHDLKQESKKPTHHNIKTYIHHVRRLKELHDQFLLDLSFIAPLRLENFRDEALVANAPEMRQMSNNKRYALAVILIQLKYKESIDDVINILISWIRKIENTAKNKYESYQLEQADISNQLIHYFYQTLLTLQKNLPNEKAIKEIKENCGDIDKCLDECKQHLGLVNDKHFGWVLKPYANKRTLLFDMLDILEIASSSEDKSIELAIAFIKKYRSNKVEWIDISNHKIDIGLSLLSRQWLKLVTNDAHINQVTKIHKKYFEIAVFYTLMGDLRCGDAYSDNAYVFSDPNKQLISWGAFGNNIHDYCSNAGLSDEKHQMASTLQEKIRKTAKLVDEHYPDNKYLTLNDKGKPSLKRLKAKEDPPGIEKVRQSIKDHMPVISIVDAMVDVEKWFNLSSHFKAISGNDHKIDAYPMRFVVTSLSTAP